MSLNNYGWGLPVAASSYAHSIDSGIWIIHAAMFTIFILWSVFFAYLLVRYRHRNGIAARREESHGELKSLAPDLIVMIFEIGLIAFYAIPVWSRIKETMPDPKNAFEVDVTAEQFAWDIHYPGPDGKFGRRKPELVHFSNPIGLDSSDPASADDVVMGNELHLPVGRTVLIKLTSKDVIHDFFVPAFRIKQDIVPGMEIPLWVRPDRIGHYELACAQLCGFGHSLMRGDVYVESEADFQKWYRSRLALKPASAAPAASNPSEDF